MRALALLPLLLLGCGPVAREGAALRVAAFQSDATVPLGHPLAGRKPAEVVDDPLLLKGIVLGDAGTRYVIAAIDWCTLGTAAYQTLRQKLAEAAGTAESKVTVHCTHTHSGPSGNPQAEFLAEATNRAAAALRAAPFRRVTHVGIGKAKVAEFASNRRVPGPGGKILVRYSATKDPALRAEPEGLVDPWLRTVTLFDGEAPVARLHYYASHPQSFYGDGRVHPDTPGWARAKLEKEEGIPHLYFTGGAGNITAGKYNDGSPEARARLVESLVAGMKGAIAATRREPAGTLAWRMLPVRMAKRDGTGDWPPIELIRLTLGPAEIVHLPGEPFVEYQLHAATSRPDRFVAFAGYGDGGPGYICLDDSEGGYEPTASRVGRPTEERLKAAIEELLR